MRILNRLIVVLAFLSILLYFFSLKKYTSKIIYENNRTKNLATKLKATEVTDEGFSFLESLIEDKKIILLGEQAHGDGTSQELKTKLILYLSDKGYDVVLFESPLYKTEQNWSSLETGGKIDFSESLYKFWSKAQENQELFDMIARKAHSESPVYLSGIDYQYPIRFSQPKITN
jgi:erythromycin esterase-like protein